MVIMIVLLDIKQHKSEALTKKVQRAIINMINHEYWAFPIYDAIQGDNITQ